MDHDTSHLDWAMTAARRICASMARADTDTTGVRLAKTVFRVAAPTAGAAVVAVHVLEAKAS